MTFKAMLLSITILISMFFVDVERMQYITIMTVAVFIIFYVKVSPMIVLLFSVFCWSVIYKNSVINEANTLIYNTELQHKEPSIKVAQDNIITAELITLVNNKKPLSFDAKVIEINHHKPDYFQPKLILKWPNPDYSYTGELGIGQVWRFKVRMFDTNEPRLLARHIRYTGIIEKGELIHSKFSLRGELYQIFKSLLPVNSNPMLYALSFGDRSYIDDELWTQFKLLGVGHLVAISGLHIGLIFGCCYYCIKGLCKLLNRPCHLRVNLAISLLVAIFYAWIAGFSLPALRAIILLSLHCLYRIQYYHVTSLQLFFIMLLVTLLLDPLASFSVGFWLSFSAMAAVFILIWFIKKPELSRADQGEAYKQNQVLDFCYRIQQVLKKGINKAIYLCHSQILLTLLMLPVQIFVFSGFSLISALVNLIFIPIFSVLILPVLLIAVLLSSITPFVSRVLLTIVNDFLNIIQLFWIKLTASDAVWVDYERLFSGVFSNAILLVFILLIVGMLFKPLQVTVYWLCLLLLPLFLLQIH